MKNKKRIATGFFALLILALLVTPLLLILEISRREMDQYTVPETPIFRETAYGFPEMPQRMDLQEAVTVSGVFVSESYAYMDLTQEDPSKIRWSVVVGDEVKVDQVLGSYLGQDVLSTVEGKIVEISLYGDPYLKVQLYSPVLLEISADSASARLLGRAKELTTKDGVTTEVVYTSRIPDEAGMTRMKLSFDTDRFTLGQRLIEETLYTGNVYLQTLVLPEKCLYQKVVGENEPWYVREITSDGFFLSEIQVERGYSNGAYCSVNGVKENQYFDSGYRAIVG